jgi:hypothetical protein
MTLLRSYLGQLRSKCRCSSCSHASRVTRTSNASSPLGKRAFQTGTVLYTAIFAAATLVDGQQKKLRRERWDDAIAVKKEEAKTAKDRLRERTRQVASKQFGVHDPLPDEEADQLLQKLENSLRTQLVSQRCGSHDALLNEEAYGILRKLEASLLARKGEPSLFTPKRSLSRKPTVAAPPLEASLRTQQGEPSPFAPKRSWNRPSNGLVKPLGSCHLEENPPGLGCGESANFPRKRDRIIGAYSWDDSKEYPSSAKRTQNLDNPVSVARFVLSDPMDDPLVRKISAPPTDTKLYFPERLLHLTGDLGEESKMLTKLTVKYAPYVGPVAPVIPSSQLVQFYHPQSPWRPSIERRTSPHQPLWTRKKQARVELATMTFIVKLLRTSEASACQEEGLSAIPRALSSFLSSGKEALEGALQRLELELIDTQSLPTSLYRPPPDIGLPTPRYDLEFESEVHQLNQRLNHLEHVSLNWAEIRQLCSMLLQSAAPPNIQTLNILLAKFNDQQRPELVDLAFDWMLDARLRPNELTHCQFLRSYRLRDDEFRFMTYIALMRGMKGALMMADRIPDSALAQTQGRVFPVHEGGSRLVQAVAPSPLVFRQVILGLIGFCGIRRTWDVCQNFIAYGWGYSYACLRTLIHQSAVESAWDAGLRWWEEADKLVSQGYPIPTSLYATMLAFYKVAESNEDYTKLLVEAESQLGLSSHQITELVDEREAWIMKGRTSAEQRS